MTNRNILSLLVVLVTLVTAASVVTATTDTTLRSLRDDLDFDNNGRLISYQLVYSPSCASDIEKINIDYDHFEVHELAGNALGEMFGLFENDDFGKCHAACLERGVDRNIVAAVLPHKIYTTESNSATLGEWFRDSCTSVEVCLMNYIDKENPLNVFWINGENKKLHITVEYGERKTRCFSSFIGHAFQAETVDGTFIGDLLVKFTTVLAFGEAPSLLIPNEDKTQTILETLHNEWNRHKAVNRTFSPLGFAKGRLPDDIFASMGALYYNNRKHKVREEWQGKGVFVNWWESDCYFIPIPWALKALWQHRLRDLVEAWAGVPVEQTDMYGLRQYETGARLLTHVDRERTHAVSLIVNIAQGNMTEPWPVEVHDHAGRLHEVVMKPGDIVYYESAKCLHGRNRPLTGPNAYYVNLFTHYRPVDENGVGDDDWFTKANPKGTPEAVDSKTKGICWLEEKRLSASDDGELGIVQGVKCHDERLGQYISPTFFTAGRGVDLFQWWKDRSPPKQRSNDIQRDRKGKDEL